MVYKKKLKKILKSTEFETALSLLNTIGSSLDSVAPSFLSIAQKMGAVADEIKMKALLRGLASGLNQETQVNKLYTYVDDNEENSFYISNTIRKALLSNSPIACTIMGRILSNHINEKHVYSQDDIIIVHALESATDYDIRSFADITNRNDSVKKYV